MKLIAFFCLIISSLALILGCLSLAMTSLDSYPVPLLFLLAIVLFSLFFATRLFHKESKGAIIIFAVLALVSAIIINSLPEYLQGLNINGIVHRSIISAILLLITSVPAICFSLYYILGATPRAYDLSRYPIILFPIILILSAYLLIIIRVIANGAPQLSWSILITPFKNQSWSSEVWQNGWPIWVTNTADQIGMRNHILGTFLLMGLTSAISLPIGMGVGIFVHQYAGKTLGRSYFFLDDFITGYIRYHSCYYRPKHNTSGKYRFPRDYY